MFQIRKITSNRTFPKIIYSKITYKKKIEKNHVPINDFSMNILCGFDFKFKTEKLEKKEIEEIFENIHVFMP